MIRGIIFDLDGTLVRLPIQYDYLQSELKKMFRIEDNFTPLITSIVNRAKNKTQMINAFDIICREEQRAAKKLEVIDGALDVLQHFKLKKYTLGLVTMQCRPALESILGKIGGADLFSSMITRDEVNDRYRQIKKTLENLKLEAENVLVIGDRIHDYLSAKKAGCNSVLVKDKLDDKVDCTVIRKIEELKNLEI
jgi:HAD superfamily hydrolase (TIGR01549 family)